MTRIGAALAALITLLALAGCGSGQNGVNYNRARIGLDSVDGQVGQLRLLSVSIASPGGRGSFHIAGDDAALLLTITNGGDTADELIAATTEIAGEIVLRDGDAAPDPVQVDVPPGGVAVLREVAGQHLELSGLQGRLRSGFSFPITFEFRDAGSVTLSVPVRTYDDVRPDRFSNPSL
jgi:copper(I)-binding protein